MTTEPRARPSPLELRSYLVAVLAVVYTISWRTIAGTADPAIAPAVTDPAQPVVWIDHLAPSLRPHVALPAGWQLASEPQAAVAPTERVVVPSRRVPRVRTRSS